VVHNVYFFACREYQIGVEVKRGRGQLRNTRVVRFVTRYQLENTTQYKIAYVQRHQLKEEVSPLSCVPVYFLAPTPALVKCYPLFSV